MDILAYSNPIDCGSGILSSTWRTTLPILLASVLQIIGHTVIGYNGFGTVSPMPQYLKTYNIFR